MQSKDDYLSAHAFFAGLNEDYLKFLAEYATEKQIAKGDVLFQQGKAADKFYLVRSGRVSVQVPALVGPVLELQVLGENQILGWSWWCSNLTAARFSSAVKKIRSSVMNCSSVSLR